MKQSVFSSNKVIRKTRLTLDKNKNIHRKTKCYILQLSKDSDEGIIVRKKYVDFEPKVKVL